jgi:hypothetical protein
MNLKNYFALAVIFASLNYMFAQTTVTINENQFFINGKPTYKGQTWKGNKIEGLLINSRMVQGIFDDLNANNVAEFAYPDTKKWDAERNNEEFVAAMSQWYTKGMNSFTLNMQGGSPYGYGNKKCMNPGFNPDGSLMPVYMNRLDKVLKKADELQMVVILGLFYFGQDQHLKGEDAIINATDNIVNWLFDKGYKNVIIEIANEIDIKQYNHPILSPNRVHELIHRVKNNKKNGYRYLVSTSFKGKSVPTENVIQSSDFILIHGNGAENPNDIQVLIDGVKQSPSYRKIPIVINEDDHFDFENDNNNFAIALKNYVSWGYFDYRRKGETDYKEGYQSIPVDWGINSERKKGFFKMVNEVTGGQKIKKVKLK